MPLNFNLAPKTYDPTEVTVSSQQIEAYARAPGDDNPRYAPGPDQVAPPVFAVVPAFSEMGTITGDPELGVDNPLMIVHGEQEFLYHRPLRPGETLVLTPVLEQVADKGSGAIYVAKVALSTVDGEPIIDQWATIFVRGAGSGQKRPSNGRPPAPAKGAVAAEFTRKVDVDMPRRYAEASGDHNPIHLDATVAKAAGLPGVINHGLGTLALVSGGLVDRLAAGDPTRLVRLKARFTDLVFPGDDLSTVVWNSSGPLSESQAQAFLFETTRPGGTIVISGALEMAAG
ncbi:MAG: MaoC/PaaZ C-terminal domain-containing protein [Acidimicrobiia bacterium]